VTAVTAHVRPALPTSNTHSASGAIVALGLSGLLVSLCRQRSSH
jgi:phosphate/sulfate permease